MAHDTATSIPPASNRPEPSASSSNFEVVRRAFPPGTQGATWQRVDPRLREQLAAAIEGHSFPVLLHGPPGTGKSCALAFLYCSFWHPRVRPVWLRLEDFISQVIRCRMSRDGRVEMLPTQGGPAYYRTENQIFDIVSRAPVLFVDDLGLKSASDTGREIAHKLFSQREADRPTFVSSNLTPEGLAAAYDDRILSRLCTGKIIHLHGPDRRLQRAEFVELV